MSKRPVLSPISSLLPAKGAAAIPEHVEAFPDAARSGPLATQAASQLSEKLPVEQRVNVSVRLPYSVIRRLREAAFRLEREKQDMVTDALDAWLTREGF